MSEAAANASSSLEPKTQEARKAESERKILRAAVELFATQGYLRTTLIEVGKAAGYTGGLVSHRFGSKEGLLNAVVDNATHRFFADQLQPVIEGEDVTSAESALRSYISIYFDEVQVRESHIRALYVIMGEALGAVPEIQPKIAELNNGMRDHIARIIMSGIERGEFRQSVPVQASAVLIVGVLRGVTMQYLADTDAFEPGEVLPILQTSAVAGLK